MIFKICDIAEFLFFLHTLSIFSEMQLETVYNRIEEHNYEIQCRPRTF